jgi:hypothetical protein
MAEKKRIPEQHTGTETGAKVQETAPRENAKALFIRARKRLFDINSWDKYSGIAGAKFLLMDEHGTSKRGIARKGDHIAIDLPGPGPKEGNGFDWVRIEDIQDEPAPEAAREFALITVRPCAMPGSNAGTAAHFYERSATSTFIVERKGDELISEEKGRNEISNTTTPRSFFDKVRNFFVAIGARSGASQLQWRVLMKNILLKED